MLYNLVPVIIFFIALAGIVGVFLRRLPDIATIKVNTIAEAKTATTKRQILLQRLKRRILAASRGFWTRTSASRDLGRAWLIRLSQQLTEFEKSRRAKNPAPAKELSTITDMLLHAGNLKEQNNLAEAEKIYLEVIRNDHRNAEAYFGLGLVYEAMDDRTEARQAFEYAGRLNKMDAGVWAAFGRVSLEDSRYDEARGALEKALSIDPDLVEVGVMLGDIGMLEKDFGRALQAFASVVEKEPSNPRYLDRLLEACILAGEKRLATETLRRLTEVNPENQKLLDFRERIAKMGRSPKKTS
jgi:tetratricopeptide (TPR) repeat protein